MSSAIQLGPFVLGEPLGSGGMGTVYRGTHEGTGVPAAVKVVRLGGKHDRLALENLASEVRTVAALDHPNIVRIYDLGVVDTDTAARSGGKLVRDTPWYAMELAEGGSLRRRSRTMDWLEVSDVLLALLDALAHSHARGILHLDLKPANVLFGGRRPGPKLTDFGMGLVGAPGPDEDFVRGTPHFMAPEQVRGRWEDLGPWTDLYALGCVVWRCVTGDTPLPDADPRQILDWQVLREPGPFQPQYDVPEGLEDWLRTLLAKDPDRRFRFAADATRRLQVLCGAEPTLDLPADWRLSERHGPSEALAETGLGLAAVREPPVVGRTREREMLWRSLREAATGEVRVVVLRGPVGSGKSRLARWLGTRAHEFSAATVLHAPHADTSGPNDGLVAALRRQFPVDARDPDGEAALGHRLQTRGLAAPVARDVAALLARGVVTDPLVSTFGVPQWWESVADGLAAVAEERIPVVVLDDVQWGEASLAALRWMLHAGRSPPAVWVITAEDEALLARPQAEELLIAVEAFPGTTTIELGPLSDQARAELARRLLPLEPSLVTEVAERSGGSPLFEVELVQDWAQRRILEHGPRGLRLRRGAAVPPPAELEPLWSDHLEAALAGHPEWRGPLEVAAVLGPHVDTAEWIAACHALGLAPADGLVHALAEARLARIEPASRGRRWSFAHPMLRDGVASRAAQEGRAEAVHRVCAAVVDPTDRERVALHLVRGGRPSDAVQPLLDALDGASEAHGEHLLGILEEAATAALPEGDPRWTRLFDHRTRLLLAQGRPEEARESATRQAETATTDGHWFRAERNLVRVALAMGELDEARDRAVAADRIAERLGDAPTLARAWVLRSATLRALGRLEEAREPAEWASMLTIDDDRAAWEVEHERALLHLANGRFVKAAERLQALAYSPRAARRDTAEAALHLGDALLGLGRPEDALRAFSVARRRFRALGLADERLAQVGLASSLVALGRAEEADDALERVRGQPTTHRQQVRLAVAEVVLRAERASDPTWPARWREARALLEAQPHIDPDVLKLLELAAAKAARPERARELKAEVRRWSTRSIIRG